MIQDNKGKPVCDSPSSHPWLLKQEKEAIAGRDDFGFNAEAGRFKKLMTAGIIDPTKVVRFALQGAASVTGLIRSIEAVGDGYKIMLMGPGEAKMGLKKEKDKIKPLSEALVHMESCDKMTRRQITVYNRDFFASLP